MRTTNTGSFPGPVLSSLRSRSIRLLGSALDRGLVDLDRTRRWM